LDNVGLLKDRRQVTSAIFSTLFWRHPIWGRCLGRRQKSKMSNVKRLFCVSGDEIAKQKVESTRERASTTWFWCRPIMDIKTKIEQFGGPTLLLRGLADIGK